MAPHNQPRLRVLITNITLDSRSGTEIVTRDLVIGLFRNGHSPMVYSPQTGAIARELRALGIPVCSSIDQIREVPDIIHGHHTIQTAVAATRFPQTPAIFVCHDFVAWHDAPPRLANIVKYVAVGDTTHDRLTIENGIPPSAVEIIKNGVDIDRFKPGPALPELPRNALIIAKNSGQIPPILEACVVHGIAATVVGPAVDKLLQSPETVMPEFDLVFASGLTAIEAMSCLRPVIVCDGRGLAGMVTLQNYSAWRRQNFGLRSLNLPLAAATILLELDRYSASEAGAVGLLVRNEAALPGWVARYVSLYQHCIREFAVREQCHDQTNMLVALHAQNWSSPNNQEWNREHRLLQADVPTLQTWLQPLQPDERVTPAASHHMILSGFHPTENWGAWSAKCFCTVAFGIAAANKHLPIRVEYMPYLTPRNSTMEITCLVNGEPVITWSEAGESPQSRIRSFSLPADIREDDELVFLSFKTSHLVSPHSENLSPDARPLGIGLIALTIAGSHSVASETEDPANAYLSCNPISL
jgi:Glycosyltransferase Family 4